MRSLPWIVLGLAALVGCGRNNATPAPGDTPTASTSRPTPASGNEAPAKTATNESSDPSAKAPSLADLPADLHNDAFDYYGLGYDKPVKIEVTNSESGEKSYGTRTIILQSIENGKAKFLVKQDGGLSNLGDSVMSLEPEGLYTMSNTVSTFKPHTLEMPAKLPIGGGWDDHSDIDSPNGAMRLDNKLKIVGTQKVTTPGGTYDALLITSTGKGTMAGAPVTMETKQWYVKGRGAVKQVVTATRKGQKPQTFTMQEAKP